MHKNVRGQNSSQSKCAFQGLTKRQGILSLTFYTKVDEGVNPNGEEETVEETSENPVDETDYNSKIVDSQKSTTNTTKGT